MSHGMIIQKYKVKNEYMKIYILLALVHYNSQLSMKHVHIRKNKIASQLLQPMIVIITIATEIMFHETAKVLYCSSGGGEIKIEPSWSQITTLRRSSWLLWL